MSYKRGNIFIDSIIYDEDKMNIRMEAVAENIRREREKRNLSISGLAERANLSASCISKAEMARSSVSLKSLLKIAAALEMPVSELLETEDTVFIDVKSQKIPRVEKEIREYRRLFEMIVENLPEETEDFLVEMTKELMRAFRKEWKTEDRADKE